MAREGQRLRLPWCRVLAWAGGRPGSRPNDKDGPRCSTPDRSVIASCIGAGRCSILRAATQCATTRLCRSRCGPLSTAKGAHVRPGRKFGSRGQALRTWRAAASPHARAASAGRSSNAPIRQLRGVRQPRHGNAKAETSQSRRQGGQGRPLAFAGNHKQIDQQRGC